MMDLDSKETATAAFITWINTFGAVTHKVNYIQELADGITLFEVLADIDSRYFKLIRSADVGSNWVLKNANLKKLYKLISRYFEDMLSLDFSKLPVVDLAAIAKDSNSQDILLLCKLILYIAVHCPDNESYIQVIQNELLPQQQEYIMISIDQVMKLVNTDSQMIMDDDSYVEDGTYRSQSELARVSKEKEELEIQNKQLIEKHSSLLNKYDKLENDKQDLQDRLRHMDNAAAQANKSGKTEFVARTEFNFAKQDLVKIFVKSKNLKLRTKMYKLSN
ncbi:uncharacterized protein EV154DRAFT_48482 [Mucor mucedo]|uniref:uncharacterized protein n=1 Tax=Mucor mucedo TaxID=29922 RepID=UPI00221F3DC0|nr:uncharacterized protein EV154DRAFT_48482 [Mucor mucedo]KAI7894955.1 hypothetical protein EV154DRAFT_48482 [Mucor mucedo]